MGNTIDKQMHEMMFPTSTDPEVPYAGTAETLPRDFGKMGIPSYSTDIAAAFEVVEWLRKQGYWVTVDTDDDVIWRVAIDDRSRCIDEYGDTLPEAICQAVIKLLKKT